MSSFQIVHAELEHLDLLVPLFDGYRQFYKQAADLAAARQFLFERMVALESVVFLAYDATGGVGFCQLYPLFSSVSLQRLWLLNDLFVAETARGRGVGAALLERARQFGAATGAKALQLSTAVTNATAQQLYERSGYLRDNEFYRYSLPLPSAR